MTEAKQVLTAEYEFDDGPLDIDAIDGLMEAVQQTAEDKESRFIQCEERIPDYFVYWNSTTNTVRVGAQPICASYEVPQEVTE